jgi:uncharacterized membrane protein
MSDKKKEEQRQIWASLLSFFIIGISLLLSLKRDESGNISIDAMVLVLGVFIAILIYIAWTYKGKSFIKMRFCVNCGRNIPFDAIICPYCMHDYGKSPPM